MTPYEKIVDTLSAAGTIYLLNEFYSTAVKCLPETTRYKAKHNWGVEYDIDRSTDL